MGEYNYSPAFLGANEKLVSQLVDLARNHKVAEIRFERHNEALRCRNLLLNLKRSLALNQPDMGFVHNLLRTRVDRDDAGWWTITIGPEDLIGRGKKMKGARYALVESGAPTFSQSPAPSGRLAITEELTPDNWEAIRLKMKVTAYERKEVSFIIFHIPPPTQVMAVIAQEFSDTFEVIENTPQFVLKRLGSPLPWQR